MRRLSRVVPALLAMTVALPAWAEGPFHRLVVPSRPGVTRLGFDRDAAATIVRAGRGRLDLPLASGRTLALRIERSASRAPREIWRSDATGSRRVPSDVSLFRGSVDGDPGSWAVVAFAGDAVCAILESAAGRFVLRPPLESGGAHELVPATGADAEPFRCGVGEPPHPLFGPGAAPLDAAAAQAGFTDTRRVCDVAVECDYDLFNRFAGSLSATTLYVTTLVDCVSLIYERDANVSLRVVYLNVWTDPNDPYTKTDHTEQYFEFSGYWNLNRTSVPRNVAILLRGYPMGGFASYQGVCNRQGKDYAVAGVDGQSSFPPPTNASDPFVVAHELGHNFGLPHTQSCAWQAAGYVPPGALLDSCVVSEDGGCFAGPTHGAMPYSTIMSYCGPSNRQLVFHPACRNEMRKFIETTCIGADPFQPPVDLIANVVGPAVRLSWKPSPAAGVIRYDVYRSAQTLDLAPAFVGSTTETWFDDGGPINSYYKVRAVRATDVSDFSNEARPQACTPLAQASSTQSTPVALVATDFNRDGAMDLVAANAGAGSVTVMFGQVPNEIGIAKFSTPLHYPAGGNPVALAVADLNGDRSPDLVVAQQGAGTVVTLFGYPYTAGAFQSNASAPTCADPRDVAAGDFDEDGIADLAVACAGGQVSILRGLGAGGVGNGSFTASATLSAGASAAALATGDFDRDGILDLAVAGGAGVQLFLGGGAAGHGDGTFAPGALLAGAAGLADLVTGDFDRDRILDLAGVSATTGAVSLWRGHGDGTFTAATNWSVGANARSLVVGDWNQDGAADLLIARSDGTNTPGWLRGHGDGAFDPVAAFGAAPSPRAIAAGDFDRDGRPDFVSANGAASGAVTQLAVRCVATAASSLALLEPNGGENWAGGQERLVRWSRGPAVTAVNLEVSRDGGSTWTTFARDLVDTAYVWTVTEPASSHVRLRVVDALVPTRSDATAGEIVVIPEAAVDVGDIAGVTALSLAIRNPARGALAVEIGLPRRGDARVDVLDAHGRRTRSRMLDDAPAGRQRLDLGGGLPPGVYVVRLEQGGRAVVRKTAVLR